MKVGASVQYQQASYNILVSLYCEGEDILIDTRKMTLTKTDSEFTKIRIKWAKEFPAFRQSLLKDKHV